MIDDDDPVMPTKRPGEGDSAVGGHRDQVAADGIEKVMNAYNPEAAAPDIE